jgi:hypothetical protein
VQQQGESQPIKITTPNKERRVCRRGSKPSRWWVDPDDLCPESFLTAGNNNEDASNGDDVEEITEEESHLYSPDSQDIMKFLENNFMDLVDRKQYDYNKLQLSSKLSKYVLFELNQRYFEIGTSKEQNPVYDINANNDFPKKEIIKDKSENKNVQVNNDYDTYVTQQELHNVVEQNNYKVEDNRTTVYNGKEINYKSNVNNRYKSVRFSIQNITKNYITEIKQEIIQQVEEMITVITNKISNENITRIEINNIKNEIINNFETKIETYTKKALDQFETKTKSEMKDMLKSFLNS